MELARQTRRHAARSVDRMSQSDVTPAFSSGESELFWDVHVRARRRGGDVETARRATVV